MSKFMTFLNQALISAKLSLTLVSNKNLINSLETIDNFLKSMLSKNTGGAVFLQSPAKWSQLLDNRLKIVSDALSVNKHIVVKAHKWQKSTVGTREYNK